MLRLVLSSVQHAGASTPRSFVAVASQWQDKQQHWCQTPSLEPAAASCAEQLLKRLAGSSGSTPFRQSVFLGQMPQVAHNLANGFAVASVPALQSGQPFQFRVTGDGLLQVLDKLGDVIQQRPEFAEMRTGQKTSECSSTA